MRVRNKRLSDRMLYKDAWFAKNKVETNLSPAEFKLLRSLADAEDDVKNGRVEPVEKVFRNLRAELQNESNHRNML